MSRVVSKSSKSVQNHHKKKTKQKLYFFFVRNCGIPFDDFDGGQSGCSKGVMVDKGGYHTTSNRANPVHLVKNVSRNLSYSMMKGLPNVHSKPQRLQHFQNF